MRFSALYRVELFRLFKNRLFWLLAVLTALCPLLGFGLYMPTIGDTMAALYLANPMLTGGLCGTLLFAVLMLDFMDKPHRSGIEAVTGAITSPMSLSAARLAAMLTAGVLTAVATGLIYLPYIAWKLDIVFSLSDYVLAVLLFLASGPVMGALLAAALWQLTQKKYVSLLAIAAAVGVSQSNSCRASFLAQWCVPLAPTMSDAFGSAIVWRTALYSRLVWLLLLGGVWLLSYLCVRQYGKGAFGSFLCHARRAYLPACAVLLLCTGAALWYFQPFVDHSPKNWMELISSEPDRTNDALTVENTELRVHIDSYLLGTVSGKAEYMLSNSSGEPQELYMALNTGYNVRSVTANGQSIPFEDMNNDYIANKELRCILPADDTIKLEIEYGGMPQMWREMEGQLDADTIGRQGVTLASKTLAPVLAGCASVSENARVTLKIDLLSSLVPVGTGSFTKLSANADGTVTWQVEDEGTDRLFLYAGDYSCEELDAGNGTDIPFYYSRKYQSRLENGALELMEQAVQYCTKHYGARSDCDGAFKIIQTTAFNFGGFAIDSISGMGESYFSDNNLNDTEKGPASAEVLAHEIIHQWWGLGAGLSDMEDTDWNDEGITVYTTYRLMCELKGEDYAKENYVVKWEKTMSDLGNSYYQRHPEYMDILPEEYRNDILSRKSGANWYDGNALMIYRAAQLIGEEKMDEVWAKLYMEGGAEMPPYISLDDFLTACGLTKGDVGRE